MSLSKEIGRRRFLRLSGALFALGAGFITLANARSEVEHVTGVSRDFWLHLSYPGVVLVFVSGFALIVVVISYIFDFWYWLRSVFNGLRDDPSREIHLRQCSESDLPALDKISTDAFGTQSSNIEEIQRLYRLDPRIFWAVSLKPPSSPNGPQPIDGYFAVFRITKEGEEAIKNGTFQGRSPDASHLRTDSKTRYPMAYVAALYGRTQIAKALVISALQFHLEWLRAKKVYAKAATIDGLRLMRKYGFRPLPRQSSEIGSYFERDKK